MKIAWGGKVPLTARAEIAQRVRAGTPVRELVQEYGLHKSRVYQILREQGIHGDRYPYREEAANADAAWIAAHLAVYDDADTRDWLSAQLRAFLERWHEREG